MIVSDCPQSSCVEIVLKKNSFTVRPQDTRLHFCVPEKSRASCFVCGRHACKYEQFTKARVAQKISQSRALDHCHTLSPNLPDCVIFTIPSTFSQHSQNAVITSNWTMLCGLLVEHLTLSDWVWEFSGTHRATFKIVGLFMYTFVTFFSLVTAGIVSKISPSLVIPIFQIMLDKVAPKEAFSPTT